MKDNKAAVAVLVIVIIVAVAFVAWKAIGKAKGPVGDKGQRLNDKLELKPGQQMPPSPQVPAGGGPVLPGSTK